MTPSGDEGSGGSATKAKRPHRRSVPLLLVVATLIGFLAVFAVWAKRQLLESDTYTETSSELLADADIQKAVATFLVDELYANVDIEGELSSALPPPAQPLAGPIAGGLRELANRAALEALSRPRVQALWEEANGRAHAGLLNLVQGDGELTSSSGDTVTLDLAGLVEQVGDQVGIDVAGKIPEGEGQIEVIKPDQLTAAADIVNLMRKLAYILPLVAIGLYALAVYLARDRRRETLRAVGFGFIAIGVLVLAGRSLAGSSVVDSLATTASVEPAVESAWSILTSLLEDGGVAMIGYGVVIVLAAWLAGPRGVALGARRALAPFLAQRRMAYAILAVLFVLLLVWSPTEGTRRLAPALVMLLFLVAGLEALRAQTLREFPDETMAAAGERWRSRVAAAWPGSRSPETVSGPPTAEGSRVDQLERLQRLRDSGVLSDSDLESEKRRILGGD